METLTILFLIIAGIVIALSATVTTILLTKCVIELFNLKHKKPHDSLQTTP